MASIDRTTIIHGPAQIQFGGETFWSKGDVTLKPITKRFAIDTASFGKVAERASDFRIEVGFEPEGRLTSGIAAVLWPYASTVPGTSIFGSTDDALIVWGNDGIKVTVHNAAITQMPTVRLAVGKTIIGPVKFTGLIRKSTEQTAAGAYYTIASAAYPGDSGFTTADILTDYGVGFWGESAPWSAFVTESGFEMAFDLSLSEQEVDGIGTVDMSLKELKVSAKAIPVGPTVAQVMTAMKTDQQFGTDLAGDDLVLSNRLNTPTFTVANAALVDAEFRYGNAVKRIGNCQWIANRTVTAGVPDPLFIIAVE